jgi:hypothetical protein
VFVGAAFASDRFAKVRVAKGQIRYDKAKPLAHRARRKVYVQCACAIAIGGCSKIIQG